MINKDLQNKSDSPTTAAFRQVSVVIPAYNNPGYLREALASVLSQRVLPGEVVVVDDGSAEDLEAVVEEVRAGHEESGFRNPQSAIQNQQSEHPPLVPPYYVEGEGRGTGTETCPTDHPTDTHPGGAASEFRNPQSAIQNQQSEHPPLVPPASGGGNTLRYIRKEHSGIAATRNLGVAEARGEFILWLDSDDILLPETLKIYREVLARFPDADVIYGDLIVTDEALQPLGMMRHEDWQNRNRELLGRMVTGNPIPNPGTLVRKSLYQRFGGYDEALPRSEDYEWWTRAAAGAVFKHCGATTLKWRWHSRDIASGRRPEELAADALIVGRLLERHSLPELFPELRWDAAGAVESEAVANLALAERLLQLGATAKAVEYLQRSYRLTRRPDIGELLRQLGAEPEGASQRAPATPALIKRSSRPLRILLAAQSLPPYGYAGTELYTFNLAQELMGRGHQVLALQPDLDAKRPNAHLTYQTYEGIRVAHININLIPDLIRTFRNESLEPAVAQLLRDNTLDVAHFQHLSLLTAHPLKVCRDAGLTTLLTLHDTWLACQQPHLVRADGSYCVGGPETVDKCVQCVVERNPEADKPEVLPQLFYAMAMRRYYLQEAFGWADAVISPTRFLKEFLGRHGFRHPRFLVEPLGLPPLAPAARQPGNGKVRLAFVGNISPTKGLDILMAALQRLESDHWELDIYGRIHDFGYYERCMDMAPQGRRVTHHGPYTPAQLGGIFAKADVTVVSSRAENFPTVAREGLQAGAPVVAPMVGGIPEIIQDGVNGLLFKLGDAADLARQLDRLIKNPSEIERLRLGITPPRTIAEDADRLEEIYGETMKIKQGRREAVAV